MEELIKSSLPSSDDEWVSSLFIDQRLVPLRSLGTCPASHGLYDRTGVSISELSASKATFLPPYPSLASHPHLLRTVSVPECLDWIKMGPTDTVKTQYL